MRIRTALLALLAASCGPCQGTPPGATEAGPSELPPKPSGYEWDDGPTSVRCAVIIGDDTFGVGPKDAQDFYDALRKLPEWNSALYETQLTGASRDSVRKHIAALDYKHCAVEVFFYSGHGSQKKKKGETGDGDRPPRDEESPVDRPDEHLSLRNVDGVNAEDVDYDHRIYDDELGPWLAEWQWTNQWQIPAGGIQVTREYPPLLVILHACHAGGFVGGKADLDATLHPPFEILMGSREGEVCSASRPSEAGIPNSYFVDHLLQGMQIPPAHPVTGEGLFKGADGATTKDAKNACAANPGVDDDGNPLPGGGGCEQHPQRYSSPAGSTVSLHN